MIIKNRQNKNELIRLILEAKFGDNFLFIMMHRFFLAFFSWNLTMQITWKKLNSSEAVVQRCSVKKSVLRNFVKFTGKHLCHSLFFNKVTGLAWDSGTDVVFCCKFCEISKKTFSYRTPLEAASDSLRIRKAERLTRIFSPETR